MHVNAYLRLNNIIRAMHLDINLYDTPAPGERQATAAAGMLATARIPAAKGTLA